MIFIHTCLYKNCYKIPITHICILHDCQLPLTSTYKTSLNAYLPITVAIRNITEIIFKYA